MARKKNKKVSSSNKPPANNTPVPSSSSLPQGLSSSSVGVPEETPTRTPPASSSGNKSSARSSATTQDLRPPRLISRHKHWKLISCFHGAWLQIPLEVLEAIAHINYNTILPRPLDPACLFDLLKVRRLFEEASALAVRAASDNASPMFTSVNADLRDPDPMGSLLMGMGMTGGGGGGGGSGGGGGRLSKERRFRMREQACRKLARAYRIDEIACSVATMQGASPLDDVGRLVLQRKPGDADARYVDFFHEKIPSHTVAESTSLQPLNDVLSERPGEPGVLRTRALTKAFKRDYESAVQDLTHALSMHRFANPSPASSSAHQKGLPNAQQHALPEGNPSHCSGPGHRRRPNDVILPEEDQPSSFESQILFQRATIHLTVACEFIRHGVPIPTRAFLDAQKADSSKTDGINPETGNPFSAEDLAGQAEYCRLVKYFAKRAMKDYMAFLSRIHYSPDYPIKAIQDYTDRVANLTHSTRVPRDLPHHTTDAYTVYTLSELFAVADLPNASSSLPPFPPPDFDPEHPEGPEYSEPSVTTCEWLTFHPLATDALHSVLLCHILLQAPLKDLQRHAYTVARLARLADGFPIFQASKSPSRSDWLDILHHKGPRWLDLADTWENLTSPLLIPFFCTEAEQQKINAYASAKYSEPPSTSYHARLPACRSPSPEVPDSSNTDPASSTICASSASSAPKAAAPTMSVPRHNTKKTTPNNSQTSAAPSPRNPPPQNAAKPSPRHPPKEPHPRDTHSSPLPDEDSLGKWPADDPKDQQGHPSSERALLILHWLQKAPPVPDPAPTRRRRRGHKHPRGNAQQSTKDDEEQKPGKDELDKGKRVGQDKGEPEDDDQDGDVLLTTNAGNVLAQDMSSLNV